MTELDLCVSWIHCGVGGASQDSAGFGTMEEGLMKTSKLDLETLQAHVYKRQNFTELCMCVCARAEVQNLTKSNW